MPSDATILAALGLCAQSQSVRLAERLASYSKQKQLCGKEFGTFGHLDMVILNHFDMMCSFPIARKGVTLPVLASLLKVYTQAKLWEKACGVYKELKNAGAGFEGLVFGGLILACSK